MLAAAARHAGQAVRALVLRVVAVAGTAVGGGAAVACLVEEVCCTHPVRVLSVPLAVHACWLLALVINMLLRLRRAPPARWQRLCLGLLLGSLAVTGAGFGVVGVGVFVALGAALGLALGLALARIVSSALLLQEGRGIVACRHQHRPGLLELQAGRRRGNRYRELEEVGVGVCFRYCRELGMQTGVFTPQSWGGRCVANRTGHGVPGEKPLGQSLGS